MGYRSGKHRILRRYCGVALLIALHAESWAEGASSRIPIDKAAGIKIYRSQPGNDVIGHALAGAGDVDGDGYQDVLVGVPGYSPKHKNAKESGAAILIWGKALIENRESIDLEKIGDAGVFFVGQPGSKAGNAVAGIGDIDADGYGDIAVGTGRPIQTTIRFGGVNISGFRSLSGGPGRSLTLANTGYSLSAAGDVNGDGYPDALFGNPFANLIEGGDAGTFVGRVTVLFGGGEFPATLDPVQLGKHGLSIRGRGEALVGEAVATAGDTNTDGFDDFLIAAPSGGPNRGGRSYLVLGRTVLQHPMQYGLVLHGATEIISKVGDVNGDGRADLLFVTRDYRCLLLWGADQFQSEIDLERELPPEMGVTFDGAGYGVGAGDVNGDGFDDLAFGLPFQSPNDVDGAGQVLLIWGGENWPRRINLLAPERSHVLIDGVDPLRGLGTTIAPLGDIENDGYADIAIGAPNAPLREEGVSLDAGHAYILWGVNLADH